MALILNGTTGITVTDGSNILQDGTVTTDDLAAGAVTSAKMAAGAAATNLGNYVQSFNGSTGAVTGVSTFNGATGAVTGVSTVNGSTGAVTVQATLVSGSNIKTVGGQSLLGSGNVDAGMQVDTNTSGDATDYALGTYIMMGHYNGSTPVANGTKRCAVNSGQVAAADSGGTQLSGTWRNRGGRLSIQNDININGGNWGTFTGWWTFQRTA